MKLFSEILQCIDRDRAWKLDDVDQQNRPVIHEPPRARSSQSRFLKRTSIVILPAPNEEECLWCASTTTTSMLILRPFLAGSPSVIERLSGGFDDLGDESVLPNRDDWRIERGRRKARFMTGLPLALERTAETRHLEVSRDTSELYCSGRIYQPARGW